MEVEEINFNNWYVRYQYSEQDYNNKITNLIRKNPNLTEFEILKFAISNHQKELKNLPTKTDEELINENINFKPEHRENWIKEYLPNVKSKFYYEHNTHKLIIENLILRKSRLPQPIEHIKEKVLNTDSVPFKVGLLFAENKIYQKTDDNKVVFYFLFENNAEIPFTSIVKLSKHLKLSRQYINDTIRGLSSNHNIYKSKKIMKNVIDYCTEKEIVICTIFFDKYTALNESSL